ncbi:hypothetical protein N6G96_05945 [Pediococcus inopinatus]|uniref:Holin n=1 Tax=Pediococcus inopinatus TaxID=114090 RepID=A0ABZ0Q3S0_9LACO|nr:hypothetical protein [Pediococcus inopinatus]WPC20850.1 hypothetical protein N6G96_05945 [Pediococcus inopinatus]
MHFDWGELIQSVFTFGGGIFAAWIAYRKSENKSKADMEGVYAHSMPEMIDKVQTLLDQLEDKNGKIADLTVQVGKQSQTIDALTDQIGKLQDQITILNDRLEKAERSSKNG